MLGKIFGGISKFASKHSALLGGLLDLGGGIADYKQAEKARKQAQHQFDQQMDHSVRRRVEDAQRAGIHPLFALGGSVGSSPTLSAGGGSPSGSAVGDSLQRLLALNAEASAKRDEAEAQLALSQAKKIEQETHAMGRDDIAIQPENIQVLPAHVTAKAKPGQTAGKHALYTQAELPSGQLIRGMNPDLGADEVGQVQLVWDLIRNFTYNTWSGHLPLEARTYFWNKYENMSPKQKEQRKKEVITDVIRALFPWKTKNPAIKGIRPRTKKQQRAKRRSM